MQFVYRPKGAEPKSWEFDPDKMINAECIEIEKRTGWDYAEWLRRFYNANMLAITAYLFVMLRRQNHSIKWESIQFTIEDVGFEPSADELSQARAKLEAKAETPEGLTDDERDALEQMIADGVEAAPKD